VNGQVFLVCEGQPASYNNTTGKRRQAFHERLAAAHMRQGAPRLDGVLYGIVYWFTFGYAPDTQPDADNISKGVWDSLGMIGAYRDDKQIRLRIAGIYDVGPARPGEEVISGFDPSVLPLPVVSEFEAFLNQRRRPAQTSLTYIEFGPLRQGMFAFNLADGS